MSLSGSVAAANRVGAYPATNGANAHRGGQTEDEAPRKHRGCPGCARVSCLAGDTINP